MKDTHKTRLALAERYPNFGQDDPWDDMEPWDDEADFVDPRQKSPWEDAGLEFDDDEPEPEQGDFWPNPDDEEEER